MNRDFRGGLAPWPCFLIMTGCGLTRSDQVAKGLVEGFHESLDRGRYAEIYGASDPVLRNGVTEKQICAFIINCASKDREGSPRVMASTERIGDDERNVLRRTLCDGL